MEKVELLCRLNQQMLGTFSQATVNRLQTIQLFRMVLPAFRSFFRINLDKEVEKDSLVIRHAAAIQSGACSLQPDDIDMLLQKGREIDQRFIQNSLVFPITIRVRYDDIEQVRRQRVQLMLEESCRIFAHWGTRCSLRMTCGKLYSPQQFRTLLLDILNLYTIETARLGNSIEIPRLLKPARARLASVLDEAMKDSASNIATEQARRMYKSV